MTCRRRPTRPVNEKLWYIDEIDRKICKCYNEPYDGTTKICNNFHPIIFENLVQKSLEQSGQPKTFLHNKLKNPNVKGKLKFLIKKQNIRVCDRCYPKHDQCITGNTTCGNAKSFHLWFSDNIMGLVGSFVERSACMCYQCACKKIVNVFETQIDRVCLFFW